MFGLGLLFGYPDFLVYLMIFEYVGLAVGLLVYFALYRWRKIYQAHFFVKTGGGSVCAQYSKVGQKNFKPTDKFVSFKGRSFHVSLDKGALVDCNKVILAYSISDKEADSRLWFGGFELVGDTRYIYDSVNNEVDAKLQRGIRGIDKLMWVVIGALVVVAVMSFLVGNLMPDLFVQGVNASGGVVP